MNEFGRSCSPNFSLTRQCQSVRKQYPRPFHKPKINQDATVSMTTTRCAFLVFFQIQPNKLKPINRMCANVKKRSKNFITSMGTQSL